MRLIRSVLVAFAPLVVVSVVAPASADIDSLSMDSAVLSQGDAVLVTGTVECDAGEVFWVRVQVDQSRSPDDFRARGSDKLVCSSETQEWSVRARDKGVSPSPGPAKACARAGTFGTDPKVLIDKEVVCGRVTIVE